MVPDQIENRAKTHLKGLLQRKQMIVRGKAVLPPLSLNEKKKHLFQVAIARELSDVDT